MGCAELDSTPAPLLAVELLVRPPAAHAGPALPGSLAERSSEHQRAQMSFPLGKALSGYRWDTGCPFVSAQCFRSMMSTTEQN